MSYTIQNIESKTEMLEQFHLLQQLNPSIIYEDCVLLFDEMLLHNYKMIGMFDGEKCVGLSGYWIGTKLYSGTYLEMDNVVVDKDYRSMGIGKMLSDHLLNIARQHKCRTIMLDAYIENESAHRFYEREGFIKRGYHFVKTIR